MKFTGQQAYATGSGLVWVNQARSLAHPGGHGVGQPSRNTPFRPPQGGYRSTPPFRFT